MKTITLNCLLITFFFFIPSLLFGQLYYQNIFYSSVKAEITDVVATSDGGFILGGATVHDSTGYDAIIIKTNFNGDTTWTKIFSTGIDDRLLKLIQTIDGGYLFTAEAYPPLGKILVVKTDSNGDSLWTKYISSIGGSYYSRSIIQCSDGGYLFAMDCSTADNDAFFLKLDQNGDSLWNRHLSVPNYHTYAYEAIQTSDGGYLFTGYGKGPITGTFDGYLIKTDANGDTIWTKGYGGFGTEWLTCVKQTADGGYIACGKTSGIGASYIDDYLLIKTDASGNMQWSKSYGDSLNDDVPNSIAITPDGGYFVCGWSLKNNIKDIYAIKTDAAGDLEWSMLYGGTGDEEALKGITTTDGGYLIVGRSTSFNGGIQNGYAVKTESNGNSGCYQSVPAYGYRPFPLQTSPWYGLDQLPVYIDTVPPLNLKRMVSRFRPCIGVDVNETYHDRQLSIYPNPLTDNLLIENTSRDAQIQLMDITGKEIITLGCQSDRTSIYLGNLNPGFYLIKYFYNQSYQCFKILKN